MKKVRRYVKLFTGPGAYLHVPIKLIYYGEENCPICKENVANGLDRYADETPHVGGERIFVPWGHWYCAGRGKGRVLRKATMKELLEGEVE